MTSAAANRARISPCAPACLASSALCSPTRRATRALTPVPTSWPPEWKHQTRKADAVMPPRASVPSLPTQNASTSWNTLTSIMEVMAGQESWKMARVRETSVSRGGGVDTAAIVLLKLGRR